MKLKMYASYSTQQTSFRLVVGCVIISLGALTPSMLFANDARVALTYVECGDRSYLGEAIEKTDENLFLYDIELDQIRSIPVTSIQRQEDQTSDLTSIGILGFPRYAAWKISKLAKAGKVIGSLAEVTDSETLVSLGSDAGIEVGQVLKVKGEAKVITDPATGNQLGVVRPNIAKIKIEEVISQRLSRATIVHRETDIGKDEICSGQIDYPPAFAPG